jgi:hypothetical protein
MTYIPDFSGLDDANYGFRDRGAQDLSGWSSFLDPDTTNRGNFEHLDQGGVMKNDGRSKMRYAVTIFLSLAFTYSGISLADNSLVRQSSVAFGADAQKVADFQKAVSVMKSRDSADKSSADYRLSWSYWAAMHSYLTDSGVASLRKNRAYFCRSVTGGDNAICQSYYDKIVAMTPPDGIAKDVWAHCQHTNFGAKNSPTNTFFLPWHRMYLYYLERTLRKASGNPNFALPYWDYLNEGASHPQVGAELALPAIVRSDSASPLYTALRTPALNNNSGGYDENNADASTALGSDDFDTFSRTLEEQPHGAIHCSVSYTCSVPYMGIVPTAANDPVFYMHHANIDRLWECWLLEQANGRKLDATLMMQILNQNKSWYSQKFKFIDENGNEVEDSVKEILPGGKFDVQYDNMSACNGVGHNAFLSTSAAQSVSPQESKGQVTLTGAPVTVDLVSSPNKESLMSLPIPRGLHGSRTYLYLRDIHIDRSAARMYNVYLSRRSSKAKPIFISTLSYFGLFDGHHHVDAAEPAQEVNSGESDSEADTATISILYFDVTSALAHLGPTSPIADYQVQILPNGPQHHWVVQGPTAGSVTIGSIAIQTGTSHP